MGADVLVVTNVSTDIHVDAEVLPDEDTADSPPSFLQKPPCFSHHYFALRYSFPTIPHHKYAT